MPLSIPFLACFAFFLGLNVSPAMSSGSSGMPRWMTWRSRSSLSSSLLGPTASTEQSNASNSTSLAR
eukprot:scaffold2843_cov188-Prasinococcus_capsulatus_cf.AAC.1